MACVKSLPPSSTWTAKQCLDAVNNEEPDEIFIITGKNGSLSLRCSKMSKEHSLWLIEKVKIMVLEQHG